MKQMEDYQIKYYEPVWYDRTIFVLDGQWYFYKFKRYLIRNRLNVKLVGFIFDNADDRRKNFVDLPDLFTQLILQSKLKNQQTILFGHSFGGYFALRDMLLYNNFEYYILASPCNVEMFEMFKGGKNRSDFILTTEKDLKCLYESLKTDKSRYFHHDLNHRQTAFQSFVNYLLL